ncbi:MAG: hypothetical protein JST31_06585 [Actinobacteria bacterium]|nr:hypothetical protein [Actinomycetota bacterium]
MAIEHEDAASICRAMIAAGVIPDFRTPSAIRLGMSPLTTSFSDVWNGLALLRELGSERRHEP